MTESKKPNQIRINKAAQQALNELLQVAVDVVNTKNIDGMLISIRKKVGDPDAITSQRNRLKKAVIAAAPYLGQDVSVKSKEMKNDN